MKLGRWRRPVFQILRTAGLVAMIFGIQHEAWALAFAGMWFFNWFDDAASRATTVEVVRGPEVRA